MDASHIRTIAQRAIHIKMFPIAKNFSERREVFRVIQSYGEVEMFQSLKYTFSRTETSFLAIFRHESSAQHLLDATPVRYTLLPIQDKAPSITSSNTEDTTDSTNSTDSADSADSTASLESHNKDPSEKPRFFQLDCERSKQRLGNLLSPAENKLSGKWYPVKEHVSPFAEHLSHQLPPSIAKPGLTDWERGSIAPVEVNSDLITTKPWRLVKKDLERTPAPKISPKMLWEAGKKAQANQ